MDNEDDLYTDLDSKKVNSGWNQKRKAIETRKKGWIRRLKSDISTGKVETQHSARETCESGTRLFPPIRVNLDKPRLPKMEYISNLGMDADNLSQSVLCMVCFSYVSIGIERVVCQHCPVVIHCSCIQNPMDYTTCEYRKNNDLSKTNVPMSSDITWTCAFCIQDVKKKNHEALMKWKKAMVSHVFKAAVVKVQSFFRMYTKKVDFEKKVFCAKVLQRVYRNRHLRVAVMRERLNERRAVRLRVHEVIAYLEDPATLKEECDEEIHRPQLDLDEKYFVKLDTNSFRTTDMEYATVPIDMEACTLTTHTLDSKEKNSPDIKKNILNNMMLASNGTASAAATLIDVDKGPFPPKSFFLTITVCKSGDIKQLYRVDLPLKEAHEFNKAAAVNLKVIEKVNAMFEGPPSVYEHVSKIKLYAPRPYVMFPACCAGVVITMVLSRVVEWPRAHYLCEHSYVAEHALVWRQVTCVSHGLTPSDTPTIPSAMRRLHIYVAKKYNNKINQAVREKSRQARIMKKVIKQMNMISHMESGSVGSCDSDDAESVLSTGSVDSLASMSSVSSASVTTFPSIDQKSIHHKSQRHLDRVVTSSRVLWTLLPTPNSGVVVGYMHFFAHSSPSSSSIKYWCVLVDKCLQIYKHRADSKPPRESVNLINCSFLLTSKQMIRIYRPSDRQVWFCMGSTAHKRQDWISWIQSACEHSSKV